MGRITRRWPVAHLVGGEGGRTRGDVLAVEEPLELRVGGEPLVVTMRTPGHDVELAAGYLVSEGVVRRPEDFRAAIHCGGPGTGGEENTYNVLDVALAPLAALAAGAARSSRSTDVTSACGVCGKSSIDAVRVRGAGSVGEDPVTVSPAFLAGLPPRLRDQQSVFEATGGLHAAALFDVATGELLVAREDVGRHNAVDKVVGWALLNGHLPATGTVLQVSGRASFELVQKALMASIPCLAAVSAPSSLAVELADEVGMTLVGFLRQDSMNVYTRQDRVAAAG